MKQSKGNSSTSGSKKVGSKGLDGFTNYYKEIYGEERWTLLLKWLKRPTRHCMIANIFCNETQTSKELDKWMEDSIKATKTKMTDFEESQDPKGIIKFYYKDENIFQLWDHLLGPQLLKLKSADPNTDAPMAFPQPQASEKNNLLSHYLLDAASLLPIIALEIKSTDHILDLCAAPGGKSVMIGQVLFKESIDTTTNPKGSLHSNEFHHSRCDRLRGVLTSYFGSESLRKPPTSGGEMLGEPPVRPPIQISNLDGTLYGQFGTFRYDKVLVDAPCSSERHLLHHSSEMKLWDPKQILVNSQRQLKLLLSALQLVKPGGRIIYATCSLAPGENDEVIANLLARRSDLVNVVEFNPIQTKFSLWGEPTKHGWICLPDASNGWGPIYLAVLERTLNDLDISEDEE